MRLDVWNNPLVVSALRQRYRHGSPGMTASVYLLLLVCIGATLHHYLAHLPIPWARAYFVGIMGLQFFLSGLFAILSTSVSMQAEVTNRTLDFQRIAALSPRQILLGKILGEPSSSYSLAITTVPLAVACCAWGAASPAVTFLMYVNLITTTLLLASLGVIRPLEPAETKSVWGPRNQGSGMTIFIVMAMFGPALLGNLGVLTSDNPIATIFGCFTPVVSIFGLAEGDAWQYGFMFWGVRLPYLCVTPVAQLLLAALFFEGMARKLKCPLDPRLSKPQAYALLIVVDVVGAGLLYGHAALDGLVVMSAQFCLIHLVAGLILISIVTPQREALLSWVWRFRGRSTWLRDSWLGARSENAAVLGTVAAIGAAGVPLLVWLPAQLQNQPHAAPVAVSTVVTVTLCTCLLIVTLGIIYQWFVLVGGRHGNIAFVLFLCVVVVLPALVGYYYADVLPELTGKSYRREAVLFRSLTPISQFSAWIRSPTNTLPTAPLVAAYGLMLAIFWLLLRRRIDQHRRVVDSKLESMQVRGTGERGFERAAP